MRKLFIFVFILLLLMSAVACSGVPEQNGPASESLGQGEELVGFYQTILDDLWKVDEGLNSEINVLAFDLSQVSNLTEAEKDELVNLVSKSHGVEGIRGTFDELSEQGYIDKENLYFETGLLITIETTDVTEDRFTFDVTKWRSGDGAYFFIDCKAVKTGNGWSYTVGSEAIS